MVQKKPTEQDRHVAYNAPEERRLETRKFMMGVDVSDFNADAVRLDDRLLVAPSEDDPISVAMDAAESVHKEWTPHDPTHHPMYKRLAVNAMQGQAVHFERFGRVTLAHAYFENKMGHLVAQQTGVAVRQQGDSENPRIGRNEALWHALELYQMKSRAREMKRAKKVNHYGG